MDKQIKVFICYDSNDSNIAAKCRQLLEQEGISANIDFNIIRAGDDWRNKLNETIRNCDVAMLILTTNIKDDSFVFKELKLILESGIPLIPFAPEGFKNRASWTEEEKKILHRRTGNGPTIGDIQHTTQFDDAVLSLQQRALEHKMAPKGYRNKRGTSTMEFMRYLSTGYLSNTDGSFNLLLLYPYSQNSHTRKLINEAYQKLQSLYAKSSICIVPLELPESENSNSYKTLKKGLELTDSVIVFDTGEDADYSEIIKWSERRVNVNKPVMRYIPPEVKAENKQSAKLKRFEEIEDISKLTSLLRVASVRSNKSLLYLRRANAALLLTIALLIVSAIVGFNIYSRNDEYQITAALSDSNTITDFAQNIVFGSSDNKCDLIFFKSAPDNRSITQFFANDTLKYDKEGSIVGAAMKCAEALHSPFYIVWERTPQINGSSSECPIIFAAYKDHTGKFTALPDSCIEHDGLTGTRIIVKNIEIPVKYQSATPIDYQKLFVACYVQPASNGTLTGLSFELTGNQFNTPTRNKLTDLNSLDRIAAAAKLMNWINVFHDKTEKPFTALLSNSKYKALNANLSYIFDEECRTSLFYMKNDSIFDLDGNMHFSDMKNILGAAMQAPDWFICYDDGRYTVGEKDHTNFFFHNRKINLNDNSIPYFENNGRNIDLYFTPKTTAADKIKLLLSIAIQKENKIMGISVDYPKSGFSEKRIFSIAERAYKMLEIMFNAYGDRIPEAY